MKPIRRIDPANLIPLEQVKHKHLPQDCVQDTTNLTPEQLKTYQSELRKQKIQSALDKVLKQIQISDPLEEIDSNPIADQALQEHLQSAELRRNDMLKRYGINTVEDKKICDTKAKQPDLSHNPRPNVPKK
jgi:hypothetical protein